MSDEYENLGAKLLSVESIFKWRPVIYEENLNEISCELEPQSQNQFNFNNFIVHLVQTYDAGEKGNIDLALKTLQKLEDSSAKFNCEADGGFFERIRNAHHHMIYVSKGFLLIDNKNLKEASLVFDKVVSIDNMDKFNKAAIYAMKAAVFALYSNEDTQKAFASIDKALKLDPDNGNWSFLKALCIRKIRKMTNPFEVPTLLEKELFKKAFDYNPKNIVFKLYLADVYREISYHAAKRQMDCSHFLPKDSSLTNNLRSNIDEKIHLAVEYYKQAAEEFPDNPYVMFRCAEGLVKMYPRFNHIQLARKLAKDGLTKSPDNITGNLVMAYLCERIDKNIKETKKHLKKCQAKRIFDAEINMIRFLHLTNRENFNCVDALDVLLDKYKEKKRHAILYSQKVSYYLFVELDVEKACDNAKNFYELNTDSTCMQVHKSCFIGNDPFSLIDVLNDEVKFLMNGNHTPQELRKSCEKYIQFINFQNIKVIQGFPQNFRQQILQGKPLIINQNCVQPSKKFNHFDKGANKQPNGGKGDRRNPSKPNHDTRRQNNHQPTKPQAKVDKLPSLMDNIVDNPSLKPEEPPSVPIEPPSVPIEPAAAVEKFEEPYSVETDDNVVDNRDKELAELVYQMIKSEREKNLNNESVTETLERLVLGEKKTTRDKKYNSDSETDSCRRQKDRRREHSHRHRRSDSFSESDDSRKYDRRYYRRHKRHSSTDSDHSRTSRHRSHKKDRYERDSRDRHGRRNRHHSSDEECRSTSDRRRRGRRDSRSSSYDRHSRRHSPKKEKSSRRERKNSPDRYSSRDYKIQKKSSKRYDRDSSPYEKKSRRRSTSREKSVDQRNTKATKSKKNRDSKEKISKTKRDQSSSSKSSSA